MTVQDVIQLRLAALADLEEVWRIYQHPVVIPYLGHDPMDLEPFRKIFVELISSGEFWIGEIGHRMVGFIRLHRHSGRASHVAMLGSFAVAPDQQGSGVARSIVEWALGKLASEGVIRVELMVETDNPRAIAFYSRLGFQQEGLQKAAYRRAGSNDLIDEIMMVRFLTDQNATGSNC